MRRHRLVDRSMRESSRSYPGRPWISAEVEELVVRFARENSDRDSKFCADFRKTLATRGVKCLRLPPRSPNLNILTKRVKRSVSENAQVLGLKNADWE